MQNFRFERALFSFTILTTLAAMTWAAKPGDWPQWRGPNRTGLSAATGLITEWPKEGPQIGWQIDAAGVGYSSLAVSEGRVVTQGDLDGVEHIICFNEADGSILWAVQPEPVAAALDAQVEMRFEQLDKNKDGKLNEVEALEGLGWNFNKADTEADGDKEEIATKRTAAMLKEFDKNEDGKLSFEESPRAMWREFTRIDAAGVDVDAKELAAARAKQLIAAADKDDDGKVARKEAGNFYLGMAFRNMDKRDPATRRGDEILTAEEIENYLFTRERGRDGFVTNDELKAYYARMFPGRDGILSKDDLRRFTGGYRNGQGDGPRGTPAIEGNHVYTIGGNGDVTCLDAETGKTVWHLNAQKDLGGGRPGWGYSESPLIDGENLIITPGGKKGSIAALNKATGEVVWRSEEVTDSAHYSSAIAVDDHDVHQIIQFTRNRVVGLDASNGKLLWSYNKSANGTANCATPIYHDSCVFSASGYGTGGGLCKISKEGDAFKAEEVYFEKSMANHHGGMVMVDGFIYGFGNGGLLCMNFKTGEIAWRNRSVGKGSLCYADGHLYCLGERNQLALVEANPEKYVEKGRIDIPRSGRPSWAHPIVANGRLYIRDQGMLTAYDVSGKK